ncbi:cell division topological specificity factor MinE [Klebsiella pneumoniae subsp. pneumoniae]|uniref:Cell division topological specificity factor n=1 Tax=Klebsiella pneumoniae subsp. pneumoniae TaxID=72407 RepID=A0A377ZFK6_KLEPN|nr:cell division topological specificity factor MinE [Klebsiella pneumoniae subsp. pneumoniae]
MICKYVQIDPEMVSVQLEQRDGDISILELNVTYPKRKSRNPDLSRYREKNRLRHAPPVFNGLNLAAN